MSKMYLQVRCIMGYVQMADSPSYILLEANHFVLTDILIKVSSELC